MPESTLTQKAILRFYRPLALSWIFMALEGPVSVALIARRPEGQVGTAAFFVLMSLALWIESPVIDLLATSTTLGKSRQSYLMLTRFAQMTIVGVTIVHFLIAATPLYWGITVHLLGIQREVAEAGRVGMIVMIPWSGLIGWRRYLQGLLIRHGHTRLIGWGTGVRVLTMATSALILYHATDWAGITIAAAALIASVATEACFVHAASRSMIRVEFGEDGPADEHLSLKRLAAFHWPLTATTMVMLMSGLVVSAALAKAPNSVLSLAAWMVASSILFLHRTIVFALPEVVVALYKDAQSAAILGRFCLNVGLATSGSILLFAVFGLDTLFFTHALGSKPDTVATAHLAYLVCAFMPLLGALQSYVRGMLTAHHLTVARLQAVMVSMACLIAALAVGVILQWPGVITAGVAMTVSMAAELGALTRNWRQGRDRLAAAAATGR